MTRDGSASTVKGDPHWLTIPHDDVCRVCGAEIKTNTRVFYWPKARVFKNDCQPCGETSERRFVAECDDEIMSGGWS